MAVKKATKKFEKNKLKGELERRNARKVVKQRQQKVEKHKAKRAEKNAAVEARDSVQKDASKDMTMDEFFQGGFDLPQKSKKRSPKRKREEKETQNEPDPAAILAPSEEDASEEGSDSSLELQNGGEFDDHKLDLAGLAEKDPDFFKYLKENDEELLEFGVSDDGDKDTAPPQKKVKKSKAAAADSGEPEDLQDGASSAAVEITAPMIQKWQSSMEERHSLTALREVVLAFKAAVHSDSEDEAHTFKYSISSPEVYQELLVTALKYIPILLNHHLPVKEAASGKVRIPTESKKFSNLSSTLNAHTNSIVELLSSLSDTSTLDFTLSSLMPLLPYTLSFKKLIKSLLKAILSIWSDPSNAEATRIKAFLVVDRLASIGDASIREAVLRSSYQALVRSSRTTTSHTLTAINIMKNSAVGLWRFDANLSYTTGFTSIRQLAIHLRSTITQPTKDSYKAIYNWQYVHSLDFWSRVLSQYCSPAANLSIKKPADSPLHPLIYPLVQITLGALRLIPTPTYFPLRFHLVESLLRISRTTNTYIPLAPCLLEVLQSPDLRNPGKKATLRPLNFAAVLRAPKSYLKTRVYQDGAGEYAVLLLAEFFGIWAKSVALPELVIPPTVLLKRWLKDVSSGGKVNTPKATTGAAANNRNGNRNGKLNTQVSLLVQKLGANAAFVEQRRAKVEFAVSNRRGVDGFLKDIEWEDMPLGAFVTTLRRQRDEKEKILEEARVGEGRRERKGTVGDVDGAMEEGEDEDEDEDEIVEDEEDGSVADEEEMEDGGVEDEDEDMQVGDEE